MAVDASIERLHRELIELANAQFDSPQYRSLLAARFTREGARSFEVQRAHFVQNRRDCWGYVQGAAPIDVKRLIWKHVAASSILEWVVSDEVIRGGGIVRRLGERMQQDLGIPFHDQPTNAVHRVFRGHMGDLIAGTP